MLVTLSEKLNGKLQLYNAINKIYPYIAMHSAHTLVRVSMAHSAWKMRFTRFRETKGFELSVVADIQGAKVICEQTSACNVISC